MIKQKKAVQKRMRKGMKKNCWWIWHRHAQWLCCVPRVKDDASYIIQQLHRRSNRVAFNLTHKKWGNMNKTKRNVSSWIPLPSDAIKYQSVSLSRWIRCLLFHWYHAYIHHCHRRRYHQASIISRKKKMYAQSKYVQKKKTEKRIYRNRSFFVQSTSLNFK